MLFCILKYIRILVHFTRTGCGFGRSRAKDSHDWQLWPGLTYLKA